MALRIAAKGGRLILWDVDAAALEAVAAEIAEPGGQASAYACNLAERDAIECAAARTLLDHGAVDVLINNAGIVTGKRLLDAADAEIERPFAVNTLAHFRMMRAFLPWFVRNAFPLRLLPVAWFDALVLRRAHPQPASRRCLPSSSGRSMRSMASLRS